ncbi:MAG: hypothetical protein P1U57_02655 [Oleibacter sp.]|nr:hypothetical protein [Thalassolituus sp.]
MATVRQSSNEWRAGCPIAMQGPTGMSKVYLANSPVDRKLDGLGACTPQLQELISSFMPMAWHLIDKLELDSDRSLHIFYVNPHETIENNAKRLLDFFYGMSGNNHVFMPLSPSHVTIVHSLKEILSSDHRLLLDKVPFLYIGDSANKPVMENLANQLGMPFYFQAYY